MSFSTFYGLCFVTDGHQLTAFSRLFRCTSFTISCYSCRRSFIVWLVECSSGKDVLLIQTNIFLLRSDVTGAVVLL